MLSLLNELNIILILCKFGFQTDIELLEGIDWNKEKKPKSVSESCRDDSGKIYGMCDETWDIQLCNGYTKARSSIQDIISKRPLLLIFY